jgi:tetratricopeptide (TPR) repeat protein
MTHFGRRRRRVKRRFGLEATGRLAPWKPAAFPQYEHTPAPAVERRPLPFEISSEEDAPPVFPATRDSLPTAAPIDPSVTLVVPEAPAIRQPQTVPVEPAGEDVMFGAAREANANGDIPRAITLYRELLALAPRHVRGRNNLALLLEQEGNHNDALDELNACLDIEPANNQLLVNRGAVLGALGRYQEAERDLRAVASSEPDNAEAHFNLGLVISRKGLWALAIPHLRRAIEIDPTRAMAYHYLGEALNHVDDLQGALQAFERAAELRPSSAKVLWGMGIIYDRMNRPQEAAQLYRRSRELAGR